MKMENSMTGIMDDLSGVLDEQIKKLMTKKNQLLKERIELLVGFIDLDLVAEAKRRFPRITREYNIDDHSESYWWNDGSPEGALLIIFYSFPFLTAVNKTPNTIVCGFRYK